MACRKMPVNVLDRQFIAGRPNQKWVGAMLDVTFGVDQLFDLAEELERLGIAFVFIASETEAWPGYRLRGGFYRIREIEEALLFQNDDGRRH